MAVVAIDEEHLFTLYYFLGNRQRQIDAPIQHHLEQQIFRRAIRLDVLHKQIEVSHIQRIGLVVNVGHIGGVDLQDAKANIYAIAIGIPSNFLTSSTKSLFSDFRNVCRLPELRQGLDGTLGAFGLWVDCLWKLNKNKAQILFLGCRNLHYCVPCCSRTSEEIKYNIPVFCSDIVNPSRQYFTVFRITEYFGAEHFCQLATGLQRTSIEVTSSHLNW